MGRVAAAEGGLQRKTNRRKRTGKGRKVGDERSGKRETRRVWSRAEEKEKMRDLGGEFCSLLGISLENKRRNPDQGGTRGTFSVNPVFPYSWMIFGLVTLFP